jgi:iron complex outermembrane recepter protein
MTTTHHSRKLIALALGSALLQAPGALAAATDSGLEEIIVTATKLGETNLQKTPVAITAFSGEDLAGRGVNNIRGLVDLTPGLQISDVNGYAQLYLRGVGSNNVFIGSDPSTTIHVDGVYLARPVGYFAEFLDIERVEVLRGPQGTLYGRNSVGGTINIISRRPTETLSGQVRATAGNYDKYSLEAYLSGPLGDSGLRGSLSAGGWRRDAWLDNESTGDDIEDQDARDVRGQLLVPMGERAELTLRADSYRSSEDTAGASKLLEPVGLPLEDSILGDYWKVTADAPNHLKIRTDSDATSLDVTRALFDLEQE